MKKINNILVTGNLGYIGSVLSDKLNNLNFNLVGLDVGFYESFSLTSNNIKIKKQISKDIRKIEEKDLENIDAIIHLAALSNDPLGAFSPKLTEDINLNSTIKLIDLAKKNKVSRFIFASSQSMYGIVEHDQEVGEDEKKNPLTTYADTKMKAEEYLISQKTEDFIVCAFRPSTVFGSSLKFRSDIVFNNLMSSAYTKGKIEIKSDGSPWRPIVHVQDVANAFISGIIADPELVNGEVFNVGFYPNGNYKVIDLARAVKDIFHQCDLNFMNEHIDNRSYRVSFNKIKNQLSEFYQPSWNLSRGAKEILRFFSYVNYTEIDFNGPKTTRLLALENLIEKKIIDKDFYFQ